MRKIILVIGLVLIGLVTMAQYGGSNNVAISADDARYNKTPDLINPLQFASVGYVSELVSPGISKEECVAATTVNITLLGEQTIDGYSVVAGNRVLVKNQTDSTQNGVYVVSISAWNRSTDLDTWAELYHSSVLVSHGINNTGKIFTSVMAQTGTLGIGKITYNVTGQSFLQNISGSGSTLSGYEITIDGSNTSVTLPNEIDSKYAADSSFIKSGVRGWNLSIAKTIDALDTTRWSAGLSSASGTSPLMLTLSGGNLTGSMTAASSGTNGYLTSTNFNTFNSKQTAYSALTAIGSLSASTGYLYNNGSNSFSYVANPLLNSSQNGLMLNSYAGYPVSVVSSGITKYSLPGIDGSAKQVIKTDGAGNLYWGDDSISAGGSMTWPASNGIAVYSGSSSWGTSLTAPSGAIVGTTDVQTLTNKTIDGVTPTEMSCISGVTNSIQNQLNNKLGSTLASSKIFVGNSSNVATAVNLSGDAVLSNSGSLTLASSGVTAGTYRSVTVDVKGRVTSGTNPTTIAGYGLTGIVQPYYANLSSIGGLSNTTGYLYNNGSGTFSYATPAGSSGISVSDGSPSLDNITFLQFLGATVTSSGVNSALITINGGGNMTYPGSGIAVSTGSSWGTSLTAPSGAIVGTTDVQTLTNKTLTAPAFGTSTTYSYATATTVPYINASKQLVSSSVTPTELSYLSGVTGGIQGQLNNKQATLSGLGIVKSTSGAISYLTDNSSNWDNAYTYRVTSASGTAPLTLSLSNNVLSGSISAATTSAAGSMSAADKAKLDGIATGANNYVLPTATTSTLGGVKVDGTTVTISNGVISSTGGGTGGVGSSSNNELLYNNSGNIDGTEFVKISNDNILIGNEDEFATFTATGGIDNSVIYYSGKGWVNSQNNYASGFSYAENYDLNTYNSLSTQFQTRMGVNSYGNIMFGELTFNVYDVTTDHYQIVTYHIYVNAKNLSTNTSGSFSLISRSGSSQLNLAGISSITFNASSQQFVIDYSNCYESIYDRVLVGINIKGNLMSSIY